MTTVATAALAALFGVIVFVAGQLLQRFFLEPVQEQRKIIGEIAFCLVFHANVMEMSARKDQGLVRVEEPVETVKTLRGLASKLRATLWTIPMYQLLARLKIVPKATTIMTAAKGLVGWSNSIHHGDPTIHRRLVADALKLGNDE